MLCSFCLFVCKSIYFASDIQIFWFSEVVKGVVRGLLDGDAFHLDEPCGSAHGCKGDDGWHVGIFVAEHVADDVVVGVVAQIDDDLCCVVHGHVGFLEQCFDVFPHALCLLFYVADVHYFAFVVDAGCA